MEIAWTSKTSVYYNTTRCHNPGNHDFRNSQSCDYHLPDFILSSNGDSAHIRTIISLITSAGQCSYVNWYTSILNESFRAWGGGGVRHLHSVRSRFRNRWAPWQLACVNCLCQAWWVQPVLFETMSALLSFIGFVKPQHIASLLLLQHTQRLPM
jgi:hypothetical protein